MYRIPAGTRITCRRYREVGSGREATPSSLQKAANLSVLQQPTQNCVLGPGLHVNKWDIRFQSPPVSPCRRRLFVRQKYHHSTLRLPQSLCRPERGFRCRIYRYPLTRSLGAPTGQGKSSYPTRYYSLVKVHESGINKVHFNPLTILL